MRLKRKITILYVKSIIYEKDTNNLFKDIERQLNDYERDIGVENKSKSLNTILDFEKLNSDSNDSSVYLCIFYNKEKLAINKEINSVSYKYIPTLLLYPQKFSLKEFKSDKIEEISKNRIKNIASSVSLFLESFNFKKKTIDFKVSEKFIRNFEDTNIRSNSNLSVLTDAISIAVSGVKLRFRGRVGLA